MASLKDMAVVNGTSAIPRPSSCLAQVPMEPYDYPDNDPGPQTLLTSLGAEQNVDRLHWHLSRFQGYVGIANFMSLRDAILYLTLTIQPNAGSQPRIRRAR